MRALATVLLLATLIVVGIDASVARAADTSTDAFARGYAAAVLEREFNARATSLAVTGGVLTLDAADLAGADRARAERELARIRGVSRVVIRDARVPAASAPPASARSESSGSAAPGPSGGDDLQILPTHHLFRPLIADPRWPHFAASYQYYLRDPQLGSVSAVSFGETIPFVGRRESWGEWQHGLQAAVFALFDLQAESKDLINADYLIAPFVAFRRDQFSAIFRFFHQSSHLGDEFILRNRVKNRVNLSYEAVDLRLSYELFNLLRVYGGGGYLFDQEPSDLKPGFVQWGLELRPFRDKAIAKWGDKAIYPITAVDFQNREENNWHVDFSARVGFEVENVVASRSLQILLEYFRGNSPNGQFYREKIDYIGIGAHFNF